MEVMGHVAVHDRSDGSVGSARLYFLTDDARTYADRAHEVGAAAVVRPDWCGNLAWHAKPDTWVQRRRADALEGTIR